MRRTISIFLLIITALWLLAGCSRGEPAQAVALSAPAAPAAPDPAAKRAAVGNDLTQITLTGRPQFLNAYASW